MRARVSSEAAEFELIEALGEGLSGRVYRAIRRDSRGHSEQIVALKILKSQNLVSWLRTEFETLSRVRSPYCVWLLSWENLAQGPALVMEYIEGITLKEWLHLECVSLALNLEVACQIQQGLQDLHRAGLLHGDLSPANVILDTTGQIKLIDFAHPPEDSTVQIGTPEFLSPQRLQGLPATQEDDFYALDVLCQKLKVKQESFAKSRSSAEQKRQLAERVRELWSEKQKQQLPTQIMSLPALPRPRNRNVGLRVFWVVCLGLMIGVTSRPYWSPAAARSQLEFRSHRWIELEVNGRHAGYTPLVLTQLQPGLHRVKWCSAERCGEIVLDLSPGQTLRLTDSHFK